MKGVVIKGFIPTSLIDYPGKICSIAFLPRCNFSCPFCFNPEMVNDSAELKEINPEEIFKYLESQKKWIDGVCLTGGEPTLHEGLPELISEIKKRGFLVKLDTNGSNPEMLKKLLDEKLLDYVAMDIKSSKEKFEKATGSKINLNDIQKSIDMIRDSGVEYEFRTTVVPKFFGKDDALSIARWLEGSKKFFLQQFRPEKTLDKSFKNEKPYTPEELKEIAEIMKPFFEKLEVRGV
jgi:pyruvate formate lyase activating enzyme